jgi:hypothetical protein
MTGGCLHNSHQLQAFVAPPAAGAGLPFAMLVSNLLRRVGRQHLAAAAPYGTRGSKDRRTRLHERTRQQQSERGPSK